MRKTPVAIPNPFHRIPVLHPRRGVFAHASDVHHEGHLLCRCGLHLDIGCLRDRTYRAGHPGRFHLLRQIIIMLLIQLGGLGYMTSATIISLMLGKRIGWAID